MEPGGEVLEIDTQLVRRLIAPVGLLLEALEDDDLELGRGIVVEPGDGSRLCACGYPYRTDMPG